MPLPSRTLAAALAVSALSGPAHAAICCTATGGDPLTLRDCEGLALVTGVESDVSREEGSLTASLGVMGRTSERLVLGLRLPLLLEADPGGLDWGVGHAYPWARVEQRLSPDMVAGWFTALGSVGPDADLGPGSLRLEAGPSLTRADGRTLVAARAIGKLPVLGRGETEARLQLAAARGERVQWGLRSELYAAALERDLYRAGASLGPAAWSRVGDNGRLALSASAGARLSAHRRDPTLALSAAWLTPF
jgi:hypothetical protein